MTETTYFVYIIKRESKKGKISYYVGYTNNPERRWIEHHKKGANKGYILIGMHKISTHNSIKEAMKEEKRVKKLTQSEKFDLYYEGDLI